MDLGAFVINLAVKDLEASRTFYEKFGFRAFAGGCIASSSLTPGETATPRSSPGSPTSVSCSAS
jgi:catechol 2,3-dioxygenase-like lactoylglutathione lyase family enzyme